MSLEKFVKRAGLGSVSAIMAAASAMPVNAATSTNASNNVATTNDLRDADIIDYSKKGSLEIHKYDITAAVAAGKRAQGTVGAADGERDQAVEDEYKDFEIQGVQFTILRLGAIEQHNVHEGLKTFIETVYECPTDLAAILGLGAPTAEGSITLGEVTLPVAAVDMSTNEESAKCTKEGVYHYTGAQLDLAIRKILADDNIKAKDALENYVKSSQSKIVMDDTDKDGKTFKDNLDLGMYLVVETEVPEEITSTVDPFLASVPFTRYNADTEPTTENVQWLYDMVVYPKNQSGKPTLDKLVKNGTGEAAAAVGASEAYDKIVTNLAASDSEKAAFVEARSDLLSMNEYRYQSTVTASEGDLLDYALVTKLPHITSDATSITVFTLKDTLSKGITYSKNAKVAIYDNKADAMVNNTANAKEIWNSGAVSQNAQNIGVGSESYMTATYATEGDASTCTFTMTSKGLARINNLERDADQGDVMKNLSDMYMVVYYNATLDSDASAVLGDAGNPNDVTLTWQRTSEGYTDQLEDRSYVFTFGIDLTKKFSGGVGDPTKVEFNLYNETDGYYVVAAQVGQTEGGKKVYYVTGKTTAKAEATKFSPDASGSLLINGLEGDKYQLTETKTDKGFTLLSDEVIINISETRREVIPSVAGVVGMTADNRASIIANYGSDDNPDANDPYGYSENNTDPASDKGIHNAQGDLVPGESGFVSAEDDPIHGNVSEANGRTTSKTAMYDEELNKCSATVQAGEEGAPIAATTINYSEQVTAEDSANASVKMEVVNTKNTTLPLTGGNGTYMFAIGGVGLAAAGAYVYSRKRAARTA